MDNSNKMVKVSYVGTFDDGHIFIDQTNPPIEFPCVDGWMPPAFVDTVREMTVGETRNVRVGADEAYEEHSDERVIEVVREKLPEGIKLVVGEMINLEDPTGQTFPARILEVTDEKAVFDTNHEAICKALNFEITLLGVTDL
ncbi:MAG: FKBP-type peptidyl-prolyl cis-trans isomerase [Raoultibacter sp.]